MLDANCNVNVQSCTDEQPCLSIDATGNYITLPAMQITTNSFTFETLIRITGAAVIDARIFEMDSENTISFLSGVELCCPPL